MTPRSGPACAGRTLTTLERTNQERESRHDHDKEAKFMADIKDAAPEMVSAFFGFDNAVFKKDTGTSTLRPAN